MEKEWLDWKTKKTEVKGRIKNYFVKIFNGMALGLFFFINWSYNKTIRYSFEY